jgi:hypothetical protein
MQQTKLQGPHQSHLWRRHCVSSTYPDTPLLRHGFRLWTLLGVINPGFYCRRLYRDSVGPAGRAGKPEVILVMDCVRAAYLQIVEEGKFVVYRST